MAGENVQNVQTTGTTLGISNNDTPVSEPISNQCPKINPFDTSVEMQKIAEQLINQPLAKSTSAPLFGNKIISDLPTVDTPEDATPSLMTWGKQILNGIMRYDRAINGGKLANQTIPPESDIYYAAASNLRIHALLRQINSEMQENISLS